jgi:hypothetical protein
VGDSSWTVWQVRGHCHTLLGTSGSVVGACNNI